MLRKCAATESGSFDRRLACFGKLAAKRESRPFRATLKGPKRSSGTQSRSPQITDTKHQKGESRFTNDIERDPGIGQSKGSFIAGEDPKTTKSENSAEGDVDNDATANDGVPQEDRGRTNP